MINNENEGVAQGIGSDLSEIAADSILAPIQAQPTQQQRSVLFDAKMQENSLRHQLFQRIEEEGMLTVPY